MSSLSGSLLPCSPLPLQPGVALGTLSCPVRIGQYSRGIGPRVGGCFRELRRSWGRTSCDGGASPSSGSRRSSGGRSLPGSRTAAAASGQRLEDRYDFLYGVYPVLFALRAGRRRCVRLWVQGARGPRTVAQKDTEARSEIERLSESLGIATEEANRAKLDRLSDGRPHQGFVLKCRHLLPERLKELPEPEPGALWVAFEGVTDPMNLGAVLRSAAFFHATGVVYERGSARLTPVASKASAGAAELLPLFSTEDLAELLERARERGWQVAGTALLEPGDEAFEVQGQSLEAWLPSCASRGGGAVLVLGSEGAGMQPRTRRACETLLKIEGGSGAGGLDSLNVSVAAGITIHSVRAALGPAPAAPAREVAV
mmetsp:Transcript_51814/g.104162  ORF Transcript_51814/g.104162 Transcript_51814/m.104162 type:complete len:370 (-) Transcript_51814:80-1189(-)